jgi:hypothetical protein
MAVCRAGRSTGHAMRLPVVRFLSAFIGVIRRQSHLILLLPRITRMNADGRGIAVPGGLGGIR